MFGGEIEAEVRPLLQSADGARRTAALLRLGMFALTEPDAAVVTAEATRVVVDLLGVDLGIVFETTAGYDHFVKRARLGFRTTPPVVLSSRDAGLGSYAVAQNAPVVVVDLAHDARFASPLLSEEGVVSGVCVVIHPPAEHSPEIFGTLFVGSRSARLFDRAEIDFVEAVATVVGSVIYRRRLEDELRRDATARLEADCERERLTAEVERQRDMLEAVIEQFPAGVVLHDARDKHIQLISRQLASMCGGEWVRSLAFEDIVAKYPAWFPDGRKLEVSDYAGVRALQGETVRQEICLGRGDGAMCTVIDTATPVYDRHGNVLGSVAAIHEITKEKAAARERERLLDEANRAVAARDDVLAVVSHDLRNPVNVVALGASLLAERADALDSTAVRTLAGRIHRAASGMQQIIGDLLDYSRIEMGRFVVEPTDQCAADVVTEAVEAFSVLAAQKAVELRPRLDELAGTSLRCDRRRIVQVLSNLIGNALKFTPARRAIEIGGYARARELVIFVRDDGSGIAPEHLSRVFDRYWQSDAQGAREGLGLGLAIVQGIVEAHGGRVWVESPPGQGATFAFALPFSGG